MAVVVGVLLPYAVFHAVTGRPCVQGLEEAFLTAAEKMIAER